MESRYKILIVTVVGLALILSLADTVFQPQPTAKTSSSINPPPANQPIASPTNAPNQSQSKSPTLPPPPKRLSSQTYLPQTLIAKLPYSTKDFSIEYFEKTRQLSVTIYAQDSSPAEKEVLSWLKQQGIRNPEALSILWSRNQNLAR